MMWLPMALGLLIVCIGMAGSSRSASSTGEHLYQMSLLLMMFAILCVMLSLLTSLIERVQ